MRTPSPPSPLLLQQDRRAGPDTGTALPSSSLTEEVPGGAFSPGQRSLKSKHRAGSGTCYSAISYNFGCAQLLSAFPAQSVRQPPPSHVQGAGTPCSCLPAFLGYIAAAAGVHPITPTILASCPQNIRFLQLVCGGCLLSTIPTPQQHQACAVQGFVKPFSIN